MIITLPITPRVDMPIGYWLTPILLDVLAKQQGRTASIFLGTLGLMDVEKEHIQHFLDTTRLLSIHATIQTDAEVEKDLDYSMQRLLENAKSEDRLHLSKVEAYVCECGAVEIPTETIHFLKEKSFRKEGSVITCRKCEGAAQIKRVEKLFFFFSAKTLAVFFNKVNIVPSFYEKESQNLLEQIKDHGVPISKERETGFQYENYNIDIEFLLANLSSVVSEPSTLTATNHALRQALITALVSIETGKLNIQDILVLPYIEHVGQKEKWQIQKLFTLGHDAHTLRYMLASSIRWNQKTCTLEPGISQVEYRRFMLFQKNIQTSPKKSPSLEEFTRSVNHEKCARALKAVLGETDFDYSQLHGL